MRAAPALLLLAAAACQGPLPPPPAPYDGGGSLPSYLVVHDDGPIEGVCLSSCPVRLAWARCVAPSATLGVHEIRDTSDGGPYERGARSEGWTRLLHDAIPALFDRRRAFDGPRMTLATGAELLAACPGALRPCAP